MANTSEEKVMTLEDTQSRDGEREHAIEQIGKDTTAKRPEERTKSAGMHMNSKMTWWGL